MSEYIYNELPYDKLAVLKLSKEEVNNLPPEFISALKKGEITPPLELNYRADNGTVIKTNVKLQLSTASNGETMLNVYPFRREISNRYNLSELELQHLKKGELLYRNIVDEKHSGIHLLQLDPETKNILILRHDLNFEKKLNDIEKINDIELGPNQKQSIREGKPVTLDVGGQNVTVGVDLKEPSLFKTIKGDFDEWNRIKQEKYDEAHPEFLGLVQTDRNRWEYHMVFLKDSNAISSSQLETALRANGGMKL